MRPGSALLIAAAAWAALAAKSASAQEGVDINGEQWVEVREGPIPVRKVGFGTGLGLGFSGKTLSTAEHEIVTETYDVPIGFALPTFDLQFFVAPFFSMDLAFSVSGTVGSAIVHQAFYWTQDVFATFHAGAGVARFIGGPGVGYTVAFTQGADSAEQGASLRLPVQLGLEVITADEGFGFKLLARPWLELTQANAQPQETFVSGGFTHLFVLNGYLRE